MNIEDIKEFCIEHVNGLSQEGRDEVFEIIQLHVKDEDIDSSNSDGSRIYIHKISDDCFLKIYKIIKFLLEN